jgi:hypothetical protein
VLLLLLLLLLVDRRISLWVLPGHLQVPAAVLRSWIM